MPYSGFLSSLFITSACIAMMVSIALAFFNRIQPFANRLLALSLFSVAVFSLVSALLINHYIFQVPHAFRVGAPFQYLMAPCAYLYVRAVLQSESRFRTYDWLHFVPFVLHTAELMPFFLQTTASKLNYLQNLLIDLQGVIKMKEGLLPDYYHALLKFIQGNIYVSLQWYLIWRFRAKSGAQAENKPSLLRWLVVFSLLNTLLYTPTLLAIFLPLHPDVTTIFALFVLGGYLLTCAVILFYQPKILYGLSKPPALPETPVILPGTIKQVEIKEEQTRTYAIPGEKKEDYKQKIESYMQQQRPYLTKGYSIKDLSAELQIPLHHLSAFINGEYGMNFSDFINRYRVEYAKERLRDPQWRQLTLEGVAMEAGFNNRITFFRAFTKLTGVTPSDYINEQPIT
jgi:AraC-like DNA-binding protein